MAAYFFNVDLALLVVETSAFLNAAVVDNAGLELVLSITVADRCHICTILLKFASFALCWTWFIGIDFGLLSLFDSSLFKGETSKNVRCCVDMAHFNILLLPLGNIEFLLSSEAALSLLTFLHQLVFDLL